MNAPFEVVIDKVGRIEHFVERSSGEPLATDAIISRVSGGERALIRDSHGRKIEYNLMPNGSAVHPSVELPDLAIVASGARIDEGTVFDDWADDGKATTIIGERTRVSQTTIHAGVTIGKHALILAREINPNVTIGDHSRVRRNVAILSGSIIGESVKIDPKCYVGSGVNIEDFVTLGFAARIGDGATIGTRSRIGIPSGAGPRHNQDGPYILPGRVIEPWTEIFH